MLSDRKEMDTGHQHPEESSVIVNEPFHTEIGRYLQSPQFLICKWNYKGMSFYYKLIKKMVLSPIEKPTC